MSRISAVIDLALWTWIDSATDPGVTVIWDKQDAPIHPPFPFVTMNVISGPTNLSRPASSFVSPDTFDYQFHKRFTLSVQVHAKDNHMSILDGIIDSLELPDTQQALGPSGLAFMSNTDPGDVSTLVNAGQVFRGVGDFIFHYGFARTNAPGHIDTVTPSGTITN